MEYGLEHVGLLCLSLVSSFIFTQWCSLHFNFKGIQRNRLSIQFKTYVFLILFILSTFFALFNLFFSFTFLFIFAGKSEFCKPSGFMSKRRRIESTPKTNRLQHDENSSPSNLGSPLLSQGKKTPTPPLKNVPQPPQENVDSDPDDLDKSDVSDSSSSDHDDVQDEMDDGSDNKYVQNQLDKDKDKSTAEGTITGMFCFASPFAYLLFFTQSCYALVYLCFF